jgi:hypothetical protein
MKEREDDAVSLWRDLVAAAVKEPDMELPIAIQRAVARPTKTGQTNQLQPERLTARATGVLQGIGGAVGGSIASLLSQATPTSGTASWLKWLNPIAGLVSLFTGRKQSEEQLPVPVMSPRPAKRSVEYGLVASEGGALRTADTDESGRVRLRENKSEGLSQVVVQVQALDSRSFLDHRDEIASAVRQALMESHGLGSVLGEFRE